jgi:hypothetical protein
LPRTAAADSANNVSLDHEATVIGILDSLDAELEKWEEDPKSVVVRPTDDLHTYIQKYYPTHTQRFNFIVARYDRTAARHRAAKAQQDEADRKAQQLQTEHVAASRQPPMLGQPSAARTLPQYPAQPPPQQPPRGGVLYPIQHPPQYRFQQSLPYRNQWTSYIDVEPGHVKRNTMAMQSGEATAEQIQARCELRARRPGQFQALEQAEEDEPEEAEEEEEEEVAFGAHQSSLRRIQQPVNPRRYDTKLPFPRFQFTKQLSDCPLYPQRTDGKGLDDMKIRTNLLGLDADEDQTLCYGTYRGTGCPYKLITGGCRNNHNLQQAVLDWMVANHCITLDHAKRLVNE